MLPLLLGLVCKPEPFSDSWKVRSSLSALLHTKAVSSALLLIGLITYVFLGGCRKAPVTDVEHVLR